MSSDRVNRKIEAIRQVAAVALSAASWLVPDLLPEGRLRNGRYWAINPNRGDRKLGSFYVTIDTGAWRDWASGDGGRDLVSLAAFVWHVKQSEAAEQLASRLGLSVFDESPRPLSEDARQKQTERIKQALLDAEAKQKKAEADRARGAAKAKIYAQKIWKASSPATADHPYLAKKRVSAEGARQKGKILLLPVYRKGELINIQRIFPDGTKIFLRHAEILGGYIPIGIPQSGDTLFICEGWATGKSVSTLYGDACVVCALNTVNLEHVTDYLVERFGGSLDLVIARDDDRKTSIAVDGETVDNPGRYFAEKVAEKHHLRVIAPKWPANAPLYLSDFNDLHVWQKENLGDGSL